MIRWTLPICLLLASLPGSAGEALIVYSGRAEALVGPLFGRFTELTGIEVRSTYQKTPALATQILAEGSESPADLFLAQDSGYLSALGRRGALAPLPESLLTEVAAEYRGDGGFWIGTSGRARVLVYNPSRVPPGELPRALRDLADPKWKGRIGWAPGNASFQAHVSALRHLWGEEETRAWLAAVKANDPVAYPKNSPQVQGVASGEIDVGWVNHYYLHKLESRVAGKALNYSFAVDGDAGNVMMTSGVGVLASSRKRESALALVSFLLSEEAQRYFAQTTFEYPTRPGIETHPDVPSPERLNLVHLDQGCLTDLEPTLLMLRELGLL